MNDTIKRVLLLKAVKMAKYQNRGLLESEMFRMFVRMYEAGQQDAYDQPGLFDGPVGLDLFDEQERAIDLRG